MKGTTKGSRGWGGARENAGAYSPQGGTTEGVSFRLLATKKRELEGWAEEEELTLGTWMVEFVNRYLPQERERRKQLDRAEEVEGASAHE